jgi:hypothetical protein
MAIKWLLVAAAIVAGAIALDRFLLWCEARGWIYWRKKKASPGTAASAMLELQSLVEPANKHVVEQLREEHTETDDSGAPPDA